MVASQGLREQYLIRCTLCPIQQWNEETFTGAVIVRINVTGQSATSWLKKKKNRTKTQKKHWEHD